MSTPSIMGESISLKLPAKLQYLNVVGACIAALLEQIDPLEERDTISYTTQLGVHEICTNIIQHAYTQQQGQQSITITMELKTCPRCMHITLSDTGDMFDPDAVQDPNLDEGQVHGYGLFLVKNVMDEVTYSRQPDGNYWQLVKML